MVTRRVTVIDNVKQMHDAKIKLLVIDDHPVVAEGISTILRNHSEIFIVAYASTGALAMSFLKTHDADVVLLDINLPDRNGIDLCRQIKKEYNHINILVLSVFNERSAIMQMLQNGAMGYLSKNTQAEELIRAIKTVNESHVYLGEDVQKSMSDYSMVDPEEMPVLTRREREILKYMAESLTSSEIAARLLISHRTIETHRRNLMHKFNVNNSIGLMKKAIGFKLI